jgi:hypothetical protein
MHKHTSTSCSGHATLQPSFTENRMNKTMRLFDQDCILLDAWTVENEVSIAIGCCFVCEIHCR